MATDPAAVARDVVESFKALLDDELREAVGQQHFSALQDIVREALAEHTESIIERLEQDLKELRSELVERRPLEI